MDRLYKVFMGDGTRRRSKPTGEFRAPRKGEYYLSPGRTVWKATQDMDVKRRITIVIIKFK